MTEVDGFRKTLKVTSIDAFLQFAMHRRVCLRGAEQPSSGSSRNLPANRAFRISDDRRSTRAGAPTGSLLASRYYRCVNSLWSPLQMAGRHKPIRNLRKREARILASHENLAAIVDHVGARNRDKRAQGIVGTYQIIEIVHHTVLPQRCNRGTIAPAVDPHHLPTIVDASGVGARERPGEELRPLVDLPVAPNYRHRFRTTVEFHCARNVVAIVDGARIASVRAGKQSESTNTAPFPDDCALCRRCARIATDGPEFVDTKTERERVARKHIEPLSERADLQERLGVP